MSERVVSIIVPVYNVEAYLAECIDSLLGQTYPYLEVLLIDDGSTDGSGKICDDYAQRDSRVRVVHKANGGLSSARNAALPLVSGEYLMYVDSDDWIALDTLEKCMAILKRQPEVEILEFGAIDYSSPSTNLTLEAREMSRCLVQKLCGRTRLGIYLRLWLVLSSMSEIESVNYASSMEDYTKIIRISSSHLRRSSTITTSMSLCTSIAEIEKEQSLRP